MVILTGHRKSHYGPMFFFNASCSRTMPNQSRRSSRDFLAAVPGDLSR